MPVSYTHLDVYKRQVYNHTGYARNYNANCSIILFRGYYFYSREFTIYIFFPPLSSYLNRKQTFMKFSYS